MSNYWNNQVELPAPELIATMTGALVKIGSLLYNPLKIIFDNQSTVAIVLYTSQDGGNTLIQWHTFPAGEAIILDQDLFAFPLGMSFYGLGASGNFSISYTYARQ
jgi:hypothetical protein